MKRYRFRKIKPIDVVMMKALRNCGIRSLEQIGKVFGIRLSTVQYHTNQKYKERTNARARKSYKDNGGYDPEKAKKRQEYQSNYNRERYQNDPEFRSRFIDSILKYQKNSEHYKDYVKEYNSRPETKARNRQKYRYNKTNIALKEIGVDMI